MTASRQPTIRARAFWLLTRAIFAACLYLGTAGGIEGAANVAQFFAWLVSIASFSFLSDGIVRKSHQRKPPTVSLWTYTVFNATVITVMVWYGWIWTASVFALGSLIGSRMYDVPPMTETKEST